jgi:Leucine-rich repeat (LRR) protein
MIGSCNSLVELHLAGNQLSELPESFGGLENLEVLDLKGNSLESLPKSISGCLKLKKLDLSENGLIVVPESIGFCDMLTDINLSKNSIIKIEPYSIERLTNLVTLDMHQNKLKYFEAVPKSEKLDSIILAFNFIYEIQNLHNATNLTVLDLHNNKIEELPETILEMNNLKTLNISNNNMNNLPPQLALLDNLVRIQVEGNPLKSIKSSMRSAKADDLKAYLRLRIDSKEEEERELKKAQDSHMPGASSKHDPWIMYIRDNFQNNQLIIQRKDLVSISDVVWDYDELILLDLSHNSLKSVPEEIHRLSNLKSLRLSYNKLTSLPDSLTQMANLKELELSDNQLGGFFSDESVIRMDSLNYLNISNNNLNHVPKTLKQLPRISTLHLSHNNLHDIQELCREEFSGLKVLDISNNKVSEIPKALAYFMTELNFFNVVNNEVGKLPYNLGLHKNLKNLQVDGNPLRSIRRAIIDRGTVGLLQYLNDKYNDDVDGGVEEWATKKKGKDKKKVKHDEEELKYAVNEEPMFGKQYEPVGVPSGTGKKNDKKEDDAHSNAFGGASTNMYNDLGQEQQDDFFWKGHQQRVDHNPEPEPMQDSPSKEFLAEEVKSTASQHTKKEMVSQLKVLDAEIRQLLDDIDNNFSLSKRDLQVKRKDLHKYQSIRNKLSNELAE